MCGCCWGCRCSLSSVRLGLGLLVSTLATTQVEAVQFAFVIMLPSVLLSGFMFPREQMPLPIYWVTFAIPATYFIQILRGVVLRGRISLDLTPSVIGLTGVLCCDSRAQLDAIPENDRVDPHDNAETHKDGKDLRDEQRRDA